jgi:hypothetical protein
MDYATIATIITLVLTIISSTAGYKYAQAKTKLSQVLKLLTIVYDAAKDNQVSEEEFQEIVDSAKDVVDEM